MAHPQQQTFIKKISILFEKEILSSNRILEIGSQNINGSVREFFKHASEYVGVDIGCGKDVDLVIPGELLELPNSWADICISTECFEHAKNWVDIFKNMIRITKPSGLVILTFAGYLRPAHGTIDSDLESSPFTTNYYSNLGPDSLIEQIKLGYLFSEHGFMVNSENWDTYFFGVRSNAMLSEPSNWNAIEQRLCRAHGQLGQVMTQFAKSQNLCRIYEAKCSMYEDTISAYKNEVELYQKKLEEIVNSKSFRYTKPLRFMRKLFA